MSSNNSKRNSLEVSSASLQSELAAIKDRLNAIETIQSISNVAVVKQYVAEHLKTKDAKRIMSECKEPRTKAHLIKTFGYNSSQALDYHLRPLREADLLRETADADGNVQFEWSNLFGRMPNSAIKQILAGQ